MIEEKVLGVFPIDQSIGQGLWFNFYDMYITDKRILGQFVGSGIFTRPPAKINLLFLPIFLCLLVLEFFVIRPLTARKSSVASDNLEQIPKADKNNFVWNYATDFKSIRVKARTGLIGPPRIEIELTNGARKKFIYQKKYRDDIESVLRATAGNRILKG